MSSEVIGATGLTGRYAKALFELADAEKQLDDVASDLGAINAMIQECDDLDRLLRSPVISREDQSRAFEAVLAVAKTGELTRNFCGLIAQKRRLAALPGIIAHYQKLIAQHRGEVTANVVSAQKLSASQLTSIGDALKKAVGSDVSVETEVDASLLGGLIVKVGSRMVDSSLRSRLQQLGLAMKGIG